MSLDLETLNQIATDVGAGRHPGAGYTPEMKETWAEMKAELDAYREKVPGAYVHIAPSVEGIPDHTPSTGNTPNPKAGGDGNPRNDYSPSQERDERGRFGTGGGGGPMGAGENREQYATRVRENRAGIRGNVGSNATNGIPRAEYDRRFERAGIEADKERARSEYHQARAENPSEYGSKDLYKPKSVLPGQPLLPELKMGGAEGAKLLADRDAKFEARDLAQQVVNNANPGSKERVEKMIGTDLRKEMMPGSSASVRSSSAASSSHNSEHDEPSDHEEISVPERSSKLPKDAVVQQKAGSMRYASEGDAAREDMKARLIVSAKDNNPSRENTSSSFKVTLDDGSKALFKPKDGESDDGHGGPLRESIDQGTFYKREVAFSEVAENLGVGGNTPVTVVHSHEDANGHRVGALQSWIDGTPARETDERLSKRGSEKMRVADFVAGNTDRHNGNLLIRMPGTPENWKEMSSAEKTAHLTERLSVQGEPGLIDHGLSFPENTRDRWIQPMSSIDKTVGPLEPATHEQIKNIDPGKLARTLMNNGIEGEAVRGAVIRTLALKAHPEIMERTQAGNHMQAEMWQREAKSHAMVDIYGHAADTIVNSILTDEEKS